jgi:hypothetical protein
MLSLLLCSCRLYYLFIVSINLQHFVAWRPRPFVCSLGYGSELMVASAALTLCCSTLTFHALCLVVYGVFQCPCMSVGMFLLSAIVS